MPTPPPESLAPTVTIRDGETASVYEAALAITKERGRQSLAALEDAIGRTTVTMTNPGLDDDLVELFNQMAVSIEGQSFVLLWQATRHMQRIEQAVTRLAEVLSAKQVNVIETPEPSND